MGGAPLRLLLQLLLLLFPLPSHPATYDVRTFGASGDGRTADTLAIARALDAARLAGGGEVLFPAPGTYLTGAMVLPSDLIFTVESGATVLGRPHEGDYPLLPPMWSICGRIVTSGPFASPLVGGRQVHNVTVRGGGVINGGGWKPFKPRLVQFQRSQGVHIDNVTLRDSGMWTVVSPQAPPVVTTSRASLTDWIARDRSTFTSVWMSA